MSWADWQYLFVHSGQTIVIATGCVLGFTAIVIYRVKSRWHMYEEDREHERDTRSRATTLGDSK